jgi:hypothetical protein
MIHGMTRALFGAGVANRGAQGTELRGEAAVAAHESRSQSAEIRAVAVERDAVGHLFHLLLSQASSRTMFAFLRTTFASVDAGPISVVSHELPPRIEKVGCKSATRIGESADGLSFCRSQP